MRVVTWFLGMLALLLIAGGVVLVSILHVLPTILPALLPLIFILFIFRLLLSR